VRVEDAIAYLVICAFNLATICAVWSLWRQRRRK
jgi:hypothetical protein